MALWGSGVRFPSTPPNQFWNFLVLWKWSTPKFGDPLFLVFSSFRCERPVGWFALEVGGEGLKPLLQCFRFPNSMIIKNRFDERRKTGLTRRVEIVLSVAV